MLQHNNHWRKNIFYKKTLIFLCQKLTLTGSEDLVIVGAMKIFFRLQGVCKSHKFNVGEQKI